ncbi:MAG: LapA family protein [Mycobacteriaceae bacterium]
MSIDPSNDSQAETVAQNTAEETAPEHATAASTPVQPAQKSPHKIKRTRTASAWTGLILGALLLIVFLTFIIQNLDTAPIQLFAWKVDLPLGISLLFAAIAGSLATALVGGARIFQLRRAAKRV